MAKHRNQPTNVDDVKARNANSGMSYKEVEEYMAKTTGGHDTKQYSNTNPATVRRKIESKNSESNPY
ncbi:MULTISPECIES: gamma-type small acid-soluble spore protein [Pontibacillus]|uniref:Gamma-type small acid-soluble spore protein n=1 Tax=Pontibacillus chungwhensis TaxID=265426 RepID=A0ABY8UXC4_9BACI|nr:MULTISPECIES: gamma-type small acid-soluble spore protein [Pontibacillus]MCD5325747.1 gamma-type small acid-soluble spore protein [Pontibacillus sp. HN14]WIF98015.1 gamma-type small acid-soluble spore protein [Pontibacillus chungwhensis]